MARHVTLVQEMPGRGFEPLRISPPDPKSGASANFATLAIGFLILDLRFAIARSSGFEPPQALEKRSCLSKSCAGRVRYSAVAAFGAAVAAFFFAATSAAAASFASTSAASVGQMP